MSDPSPAAGAGGPPPGPGESPRRRPGRPPPRPRRSRAERLAARLYVGPLGHLAGFVADVADYGGRHLLARVRARLTPARRR